MDKSTSKEKSSPRKYKDDRRDDRDRHRDGYHRTRDDDDADYDDHRHRSDDQRCHRRSDRDSRRERSYDELDEVDERSRSRSSTAKRKERGDSEDNRHEGVDKKHRVSRKFEDKADVAAVEKSDDGRVKEKVERRERRRFGDKVKEEPAFVKAGDAEHLVRDDTKVKNEVVEGLANNNAGLNGDGAVAKGAAVEPPNMISKTGPSLDPSHHHHTKVSSIYTTNENKGVSITGSHVVPGKSSTDGTSTAGKTGNLSLDALAKAKQALKKQKELNEKINKIPLVSV